MAERLAILLEKREGTGRPDPGPQQGRCALVTVDGDWWTTTTEGPTFERVFGAQSGKAELSGIFLDLKGTGKDPILTLNSFHMDNPKSRGIAFCDHDPRASYHWLSYTYYWRIINPSEMSTDERPWEVWYLLSEQILPAMNRKFART